MDTTSGTVETHPIDRRMPQTPANGLAITVTELNLPDNRSPRVEDSVTLRYTPHVEPRVDRSLVRLYPEKSVVNDPNVKGLVVGICLAFLVAVFGSLAVDTFFGRDPAIESPLRGN